MRRLENRRFHKSRTTDAKSLGESVIVDSG